VQEGCRRSGLPPHGSTGLFLPRTGRCVAATTRLSVSGEGLVGEGHASIKRSAGASQRRILYKQADAWGDPGRSALSDERLIANCVGSVYYSVRAHFEDEHPSPYFLSAVMREDVMRTENGVSRLTLHASLLTHSTSTVRICADG
jgi:hypothetical protein